MCKYQTGKQLIEYTASLPPITWYVPNILPAGYTLIAGKSGSGKSFFNLQLGLDVAAGTPFLGFPVKQAKVLYLDFEESEKMAAERIRLIMGDQPVPDGFYIATQEAAEDWQFETGGFEKELTYIAHETDINVVIIDTINYIKPRPKKGETENDIAYRLSKTIAKCIGGTEVALLVVMHTTKVSHQTGDPFDDFLGSQGYKASSQHALKLSRQFMSSSGVLENAGKICQQGRYELNFDMDNCRWSMVGSAAEMEQKRQAVAYDNKPAVRMIHSLLSNKDTWIGTAMDAINETGSTMSAESIGKYFNRTNCQEILTRDGITVMKKRGRRGTEYYITRKTDIDHTGYEKIA